MKWLLRLVILRLLGTRAVTLLALIGLIRTIRAARAHDVDRAEPRIDRVRRRSSGKVR